MNTASGVQWYADRDEENDIHPHQTHHDNRKQDRIRSSSEEDDEKGMRSNRLKQR